jgi:hypothetical protein
MPSTLYPNLKFSQPVIRSAGAHTNSQTQQPAAASGGGGGSGGALPKSAVVITTPAGAAVAQTGAFNAQSYNVVPANSGATNVANLNTLIAALNATAGGSIYFPAGSYSFASAPSTITVPCEIFGAGMLVTILNQSSATANMFTLASNSPFHVHDIQLSGGGSTGSGYGIQMNDGTGGSSTNNGSTIQNVEISNFATGVYFYNATIPFVFNCTIGSCNYGLSYTLPYHPDDGAGIIQACTLSNNTVANIYQTNVDGLGIYNCFLYGSQYGLYFVPPANFTGVDLYIVGNHIEGHTNAGIFLSSPPTGSGVLQNIVIVGNEIVSGCPAIATSQTAAVVWLNQFVMVGNVLKANSGTNKGVQIYYAENGTIAGNVIASSGVEPALYLDASCSGILVGSDNVFSGNTSISDAQTYTVAALPAAASMAGQRRWVTDATVTTFASNVAGGGANTVPVFSNGTNWIIG